MDSPPSTIESPHPSTVVETATVPVPPPEDVLAVLASRQVQGALGFLLAIALALAVRHSLVSMNQGSPTTLPARLELNQATQAELVLLPGIGNTLAERIVQHRADHGPFTTLDDLEKIPGVGPKSLALLRDHLEVHSAAAVDAPRKTPHSASLRPFQEKPRTPSIPTLPDPGSIDLNAASIAELDRLPGIGPKLAQRILEERSTRPFAAVDDIVRVKGIGTKTLEKLRPYARVKPATVSKGGRH